MFIRRHHILQLRDADDELKYKKSSRGNYVDFEIEKSSRFYDDENKKCSRHEAAFERKNSLIQESKVHSRSENKNDPMKALTKALENLGRNGRPQVTTHELPTFWGEPETWINFHRQLISSTNLNGYTEEDNILRLQKCLKGKAKDAVESLLVTSCSVDEIVKTLQNRFGRPHTILKSLMNKARNVEPPNDRSMESIMDFAIAVKNLCATAVWLRYPEYLYNPQILEEFVGKLPTHLKLDWGKYVQDKTPGKYTLEDLSRYLNGLSEAASFVGDMDSSSERKGGNERDRRERDRREHDRREHVRREQDRPRRPHFAMTISEEKCDGV